MGVDVVLVASDGGQVRALPDPAGGTFDAAGDFDRLLADAGHTGLPVWSSIDPYGVVEFSADAAQHLLDELPAVVATAEPGPEQRGLRRLAVLCHECVERPASLLRCTGD